MSKVAHLIAIGQLKDPHWEALEKEYLGRLTHPKLQLHELKSFPENKPKEGAEVLKKIKDITKGGPAQLVALTEFGKEFDSPRFSQWLTELLSAPLPLIFILGGVQGHDDSVLKVCTERLSLSQLTFPHKMARLVFIEQYYRAQTIKNNHPYHY